ncbi:O-methyltransferase involved in polyketide biosynthesis [Pseudonocardia hierapolitana]|uniref:O-methyltransferase involved in polyketide biosynthesis n=1 Tax=Pseudonocardia hierapolitana TaxID=1128676 RepID=A0A561T086_9PSEU|nr:SAM-dependent methyltransferase [Pseudonocardia hierapolitana]TWF80538.1 O-methyltransferase involved in polyketide biosynthesis [Pseudonocardia hierapolitana]
MADGTNGHGQVQRDIDTTTPHSARIWNYWLGGKDNYEADREAGDEFLAIYPGQRDKARACRHFLLRTVRYLVIEQKVRQFLDIGTGLPTANNTHEVAQRDAPESRIVYVDNDPLVLAHARALLTSTPEGITNYIDADLHDPESIMAEAGKTLDFSQPIALLLIGVLGHIQDYDEARSIVSRLLGALPAGSYLVQCDGDDTSPAYVAALERYRDSGGVPYNVRSREQIRGFYQGLELVEPGVVPIQHWRPEPNIFGEPPAVAEFGGVGRKS